MLESASAGMFFAVSDGRIMENIKAIGILTSGGDAPGMNAAIRAVTRAAIYEGWKVFGIYRGFEGLIGGEIKEFTTESVSNTIQRGGTILKTARSRDFMSPEGRAKAAENLRKFGIDALVVIRLPYGCARAGP